MPCTATVTVRHIDGGAKFGLMLTRRLFVNGLTILATVCVCCVCCDSIRSVLWEFYVLWKRKGDFKLWKVAQQASRYGVRVNI